MIFLGDSATLLGATYNWSGTTSRSYPMSFTISSDGKQMTFFTLKTNFSSGGASGTIETNVNSASTITNGQFSYSSSTYSYTGQFDSTTTASGTYEYSSYPQNYQGGWGYMLLTNFLPGGGNGVYTLSAITVDNANAVKPFGAIDTPAQGGSASGKSFVNQGWLLTPMPNKIPEDGTTIDVYVDGKKLGHPHYNYTRPDIAGYFPGYANSGGPAAL
jgi:hypothetical protein